MRDALFTHSIIKREGLSVIIIIDHYYEGCNHLTVTNDIENVLERIRHNMKAKSLSDYGVMYKDSDGDWTGYDVQKGTFMLLPENMTYNKALIEFFKLRSHHYEKDES